MKTISKKFLKAAIGIMLTAGIVSNCVPAYWMEFESTVYAEEVSGINYDISMGSKEFPLNKSTIDCTHTDASYPDCITLRNSGQYVEYDIYMNKEQRVGFSVFCGTINDSGCLSVSVNGNEQLAAVKLKNTGEYSIRDEHSLGAIKLSVGKNTIKLVVPSSSNGALVISKFKLSEYYDINDEVLSREISVNKNTIEVMENAAADENQVILNNTGAYFEYDVTVKNEGKYAVSAFCGISKNDGCLSVTVNGEMQIADKLFTEAATGYDNKTEQKLGNLVLQAGDNKLRFICSDKSADKVYIKSFKLEKNDSADVRLSSASSTRLEIEDYTNLNVEEKKQASGDKWVCNEWSYTFSPIYMYIEAEEDGYYNLDYTMIAGTRGVSNINIYFDGEKIADNQVNKGDNYISLDEEYGKPFDPWAEFNKYTQKNLYIKKGVHAVKITVDPDSAGIYKYMMDYIEFKPVEDCYDITYFGAVTDDGARHPYAVRKGYTGYAKIKLLKYKETQETVSLYLAEYKENGQLVNVSMKPIDIGQMEVSEEKEFTLPLTYTEDGGTIKAFVMDGETMTPLKEASVYEQIDIFHNVQDIMNEATGYVLAKDVKDGNGNNYEDCSTHDDKYDIDAIFYDSDVGDQSKVFAYIGVPKGASKENPVPAVVCVHGGAGMAFDQWVKLWNDKGYAAIAMTLTGDGPIKGVTPGTATQYEGKNRHPYAGTEYKNEFDEDIEKALMYRDILNVIRANNVLRSYPGVDENKIGITGISWGGIKTTITIGLDDRFVWATPVYGAGYLDESETYFGDDFKRGYYATKWDPANFAARAKVPTLYINSDTDMHFSITVTSKTCGVTENSRMSVRHKYGHSYGEGWSLPEIYTFADSMVKSGTDPFIKVSDSEAKDGVLTAKLSYPDNVTVQSVNTYYITDEKHPRSSSTDWKLISDYSITDTGISVKLPSDATFCYATITDSNGSLISTRYVKVK